MRQFNRSVSLALAAMAAAVLATLSPRLQAADENALTPEQKDALQQRVSVCDKSRADQRADCVQRARNDYAGMDPSLSPAQKAAMERENARYQAAITKCMKLGYTSERNTCLEEAGNDPNLIGAK